MSDHDKDWKTPVPLTGKPITKRIYCWTRRQWITRTCILLGAREIPASVPYAQRQEMERNRGRHHKTTTGKQPQGNYDRPPHRQHNHPHPAHRHQPPTRPPDLLHPADP